MSGIYDKSATLTESKYREISADKYDALMQRYLTVELEKTEYQKEIQKLQQQNEELKQRNAEYLERMNDEWMSTPILANQLLKCNLALEDVDSEKEVLSNKNKQYEKINAELLKKNSQLEAENKKYQIVLDKMQNEHKMEVIEFENLMKFLKNQIIQLNNVNAEIEEKYEQTYNDLQDIKMENDVKLKEAILLQATRPSVELKSNTIKIRSIQLIQSETNVEQSINAYVLMENEENDNFYYNEDCAKVFTTKHISNSISAESPRFATVRISALSVDDNVDDKEDKNDILSMQQEIEKKNQYIASLEKQVNQLKQRNQRLRIDKEQEDSLPCSFFDWISNI